MPSRSMRSIRCPYCVGSGFGAVRSREQPPWNGEKQPGRKCPSAPALRRVQYVNSALKPAGKNWSMSSKAKVKVNLLAVYNFNCLLINTLYSILDASKPARPNGSIGKHIGLRDGLLLLARHRRSDWHRDRPCLGPTRQNKVDGFCTNLRRGRPAGLALARKTM